MTIWRFLRERWFSIDLRTLGLFRIAFGLCLMANLLEHALGPNLVAFFTNDGVLSNHFALFSPIQPRIWSLLFAFSRPGEVALAFTGIGIIYALFIVGWRTRLMQILVLACVVSLANRNLLLQDGGTFVCELLALWTLFLPLGARLSVDRWLATRATSDPAGAAGVAGADAATPSEGVTRAGDHQAPRHVSFVCFALAVQVALIYGFNALAKGGANWHDGTALHYVLWLNSKNTMLAGWLRHHEPRWFSPMFSWSTLGFEISAPFLVLTPVFQTVARRALIIGMIGFHIGIASMMSLGPFPYAMMAFSLLFLGARDWAFLEARVPPLWARLGGFVRRASALARGLARLHAAALAWREQQPVVPARGRTGEAAPLFSSKDRRRFRIGLVGARELLALLFAVAMFSEVTVANNVIPERYRMNQRPQWMADMLAYLRIYQSWQMFAPEVPRGDGKLVVDAVLSDGSHFDPLTGAAPDYEAPLGQPYLIGHDWSEYYYYFPWDRHRQYRGGFRDYILNLAANPDRVPNWPEGRTLRSFQVFWVSADGPPPGGTRHENLKREFMIGYGSPP